MVNDFVSNKLGKTKVQYPIDALEGILKETYGMIVYQEQVMQIASVIGGFSLGQADMLRRAMGKKKKSVMDKMREDFLVGAEQRTLMLKKHEMYLNYVTSLLNMVLINHIVQLMHWYRIKQVI